MQPRLLRLALFGLSFAILAACDGKPQQQQQVPHVTVANELAAISRLQGIAMAELKYQADNGVDFATLDQLIQNRYVGDPSDGKIAGYKFDVRLKPGGFEATAVPVKFGVTGNRSFYIDQSKTLRGADKAGAQATAADPTV